MADKARKVPAKASPQKHPKITHFEGPGYTATLEVVANVLIVKACGVISPFGAGLLTGAIWRRYTDKVRALIVDYRSAVLAVLPWELSTSAMSDELCTLPTVFVANGVAHDTLRVFALRCECLGFPRRVTGSTDAATTWARKAAAMRGRHA